MQYSEDMKNRHNRSRSIYFFSFEKPLTSEYPMLIKIIWAWLWSLQYLAPALQLRTYRSPVCDGILLTHFFLGNENVVIRNYFDTLIRNCFRPHLMVIHVKNDLLQWQTIGTGKSLAYLLYIVGSQEEKCISIFQLLFYFINWCPANVILQCHTMLAKLDLAVSQKYHIYKTTMLHCAIYAICFFEITTV